MYDESLLPVIEAGQAELVEGAHGVGDHVTLMPTPGHTGGMCRSGCKAAGPRR